MNVVVQFPVLREVKVDAFRGYLSAKTSDAELLDRAERLVVFARDGQGLTNEEAAAAADEIAFLLGLGAAASAHPDGPGIILLGAAARVALRRKEDVTAAQVRALATAGSRPRQGLVAKAGSVPFAAAVAYLENHGVTP